MLYAFEDFSLDTARRELRRDGALLSIQPQVFDVLQHLICNREHVVSRDDLLASVWNGRIVSELTLSTRINAARTAVGDSGEEQRLIRTVSRKGVRFVGVVREAGDGPGALAPSSRPPAAAAPGRRRLATRRLMIAASLGAMLVLAMAAWSLVARTPAPRLSMVVLPFASLSNDPDQEHFADSLADDLTTSLSRISGAFVIARNTAFTYRGKSVDARRIGRELGVRYVIEGSVRRTGDPARVNIQLIDAESGANAWADQFDADRASLAEARNDIAGRLARTLALALAELVGRRIESEASADPDARDLVMRGWAFYYRPVSAPLRQQALRAFARALEIDPRSADAGIGIGAVLVDDLVLGLSGSRQQDEARAQAALGDALERDASQSMAHFAMGALRRLQNRLGESQIELEAATALDGNNARALEELGITLMFLGHPAAAIPHIERAIRLNPHDPNIAGGYWALGASHLALGHGDQASDLLRRARAANPRLHFVHLWLAGALGLAGDVAAARAALAEAIRLRPELGSLQRWRAANPWTAEPRFAALAETTLYAGLRRAGLPEQ